MNTKGKAESWMVILLVVVGAYLLIQSGTLKLGGTGSGTPTTPTNLVPSDLKTTVTLNTYDGLSTTPLPVNLSYYVFKSTGEFVKEGSTSAGTASFTVQYGNNYKVLMYKDGTTPGGLNDYLPEEVSFTADSGEGSVKTVNANFYRESNATITVCRDPIDLNSNISTALGSTESWQVLWKTTTSNAAIKNPILVVDTNHTTTEDIAVNGWTEITCPSSLTTASCRDKYCFKKDGVFTSSQGIQTIDGTIKFDSVTAGGAKADYITFDIMDETAYLDPDYVVKGYSAFHIAPQNPQKTNIGATNAILTAGATGCELGIGFIG